MKTERQNVEVLKTPCPDFSAFDDLVAACRMAEALLTTQLNEANNAVTVMPHPQYEPGPILTALRDALAKARPTKPPYDGGLYE